jgi:hypothetical protein
VILDRLSVAEKDQELPEQLKERILGLNRYVIRPSVVKRAERWRVQGY